MPESHTFAADQVPRPSLNAMNRRLGVASFPSVMPPVWICTSIGRASRSQLTALVVDSTVVGWKTDVGSGGCVRSSSETVGLVGSVTVTDHRQRTSQHTLA
jgi:hypothetical protein